MQQGPRQSRTALSHIRHCALSASAAASGGQPPRRSPRRGAALGQLDMVGGSDHLLAAALRAQVQAASEGAAQGSVGATLPRPINPLAAGAPPRGAGVSQLRRRLASQATAIRALSARCTFLEVQAEQRERQRRADHSHHQEVLLEAADCLRLLCRESLEQHQTLNTLLVSLREGEDVVALPQPRLVTDHRWMNTAPQPRRSEPPRGSRSRSRSPAARSALLASRVEAALGVVSSQVGSETDAATGHAAPPLELRTAAESRGVTMGLLPVARVGAYATPRGLQPIARRGAYATLASRPPLPLPRGRVPYRLPPRAAELAPPTPLVLRPNPRWDLLRVVPRPGTARVAVVLRPNPLRRQGVPVEQPVIDPRDQATSSPSVAPQDGEHHVEE